MILQATLYHYISSMIHKTHKKKQWSQGRFYHPASLGTCPSSTDTFFVLLQEIYNKFTCSNGQNSSLQDKFP